MLSLTYVSSASELLSSTQLVEMLEVIRPRNLDLDLTGMLLYSGGNIIQVIEGPEPSVDKVFSSIERDPRHRGVLVLLREPVDERSFSDWTMGFRSVDPAVMAHVDGLSDFVERSSGGGLGRHASAAYQLLEMFRDNMR